MSQCYAIVGTETVVGYTYAVSGAQQSGPWGW